MINDSNNNYFSEYEKLLIELSDAMRVADAEKANLIRRQMEGPERHLTDSMMERLDGLAADLYMLSGKELPERTDPAEAVPAKLGIVLRQAWEREEWDDVLLLLRKKMPFLSDEHRAYLRAVAYEHLGQLRSASVFMDYASHLNQNDMIYRYFGLDYLRQSGQTDKAVARARQYIADPTSAPVLLIEAAVTLVQTSRELPMSEFRSRASESIPALIRSLNNGSGLEGTPREVIALAYVTLGFCLQHLGDTVQADLSYHLALKVDPRNDAAQLGLRAVLEERPQSNTQTSINVAVPIAASDADMSNVRFETVKARQIWLEAA